MRHFLWFNLLACCATFLGLFIPLGPGRAFAQQTPSVPVAPSEDVIAVHLASGRTFTAALDARTDATQLWLRFERGGGEILRPIGWDRVVWAEVAGETLPGAELRRLVVQLREEIPAQPVAPPAMSKIVMIGAPEAEPAADRAARQSAPAAETPRVVSLSIDARPARWDENVEPDGLLVRLYPLDADGMVVPVRGTLDVDLKVQQRNANMLHEPFVGAGRWTELVRTTDFGPTGAVYRLRFQGLHPEFEDGVQSPGSVHARLSIPGQGTFEASTYLPFIRPFNPVRDRLQSLTRHGYFSGQRYFPNERTDDGRR